jgi:hypothetical protein
MIHTIWIGPLEMDKYHEYNLISIYRVYGIKPTLWVHDHEVSNTVSKLADVREIPSDIIDTIKGLKCSGGYSNNITDDLKAVLSMTDYIRYVILYTYGGIYFDMDGISNNHIMDIPGAAECNIIMGTYSYGAVNGAVIYVNDKHNPHIGSMAEKFIEMMNSDPNKKVPWAGTGPDLLTQYVKDNRDSMNIIVMSHRSFYIHNWETHETARIFAEGGYSNEDLKDVYYLHLWGSQNCKLLKMIDDEYVKTHDNLYTAIARKVL